MSELIALLIKAIPYIACAVVPSVFFIKHNIKKNKEHKEENADNIKTIKSLRNQILEMALLEGEKTKIDKQSQAIKNNVLNSDNINESYTDKLPNIPKKRSTGKTDSVS